MLAEGKMQSQDIENKIIHVVMVAYYEDILPIKWGETGRYLIALAVLQST